MVDETEETTDQEPTSEQEPEPATDPEPASQRTRDEFKIVITLKGARAMVGIQSPGCDPVISTIQADLGEVLQRIPGLMEEAKHQWDESPRYPKADLPAPAPPPVSSTTRATESPAQPKFF